MHRLHADLVTVSLRDEYVRVALIAAEHLDMSVMWKDDLAVVCGVIDLYITGMAGGTVAGDTEGFFAIVAQTAGLTFFHLGHGEGWVLLGDYVKDLVMACRAVLADGFLPKVVIVTELNLAD